MRDYDLEWLKYDHEKKMIIYVNVMLIYISNMEKKNCLNIYLIYDSFMQSWVIRLKIIKL
jgi:hypothetical protein